MPKNETKAFEMFVKASEAMGSYYNADEYEIDAETEAMMISEVNINLAVMYLEGQGTAKNVSKAFKIFTDAANFGFLNAAYNLGTLQFQNMYDGIENNFCAAVC